jgi:hypothetical protein
MIREAGCLDHPFLPLVAVDEAEDVVDDCGLHPISLQAPQPYRRPRLPRWSVSDKPNSLVSKSLLSSIP